MAQQLLDALPDPGISAGELAVSWSSLLRHVSAHCREGDRFGLILDKFPYLVEQSPELPSVLQAWWDREGVHSAVLVILCGSQLSVMAALGTEIAPLFGRFNAGITLLPPLRYDEVAEFYRGRPLYDSFAAMIMYGVLGGAPSYHAMVDTERPPGDEIVDRLLRPRCPLENEVRFLLGTQQIRDPAPYNAVLAAIASGQTQFGRIQQALGAERGAVSFYLRTLQDLGWIYRELSFGETTARRAPYRAADPFLAFWYRFVAPLASERQFSAPARVYEERVRPYLADYMGAQVFESICKQWLQRHGHDRLGQGIREARRYWSRGSEVELDVAAEMEDGATLFGECKWNQRRRVGLGVLAELKAKVAALPREEWRHSTRLVLFAAGGFSPELRTLAADPVERLLLVDGADLLPGFDGGRLRG